MKVNKHSESPMTPPSVLLFATIAGMAIVAAGAVFVLSQILVARLTSTARSLLRDAESSVVFLFDDRDLVDSTPSARDMLRGVGVGQSDWDTFVGVFGPHFPHLRRRLAGLAETGVVRITSADNNGLHLEAEYWDGLVRLTLIDSGAGQIANAADQVTLSALEEEVAALRAIAEDAPQLIWKQDIDGSINWANRAYIAVADQTKTGALATWPLARIIDDGEAPTELSPRLTRRLPVTLPGQDAPLWFEVTSVFRGSETVHFAIDANAVIRAEETRRSFVQTLGKTFAELSIGLAIFDRSRRLMTFNPALMDLTGLTIEFLSGRPLIHSLLDRLREARMLPEPKNYISWREEIAALESAAKNGSYCENWDLPNGQTYRVTGRPHPDGAVAFLFEDITAEVSLTRRFRSEIETARAVLDGVDDSVAVFSQTGAMTMSNTAYSDLWGAEPLQAGLGTVTAVDATRVWQDRSVPTPLWARIREYVSGFGDRAGFSELVTLQDGRQVDCRVGPLPGGSSMIRFRVARAAVVTAPLRRISLKSDGISA